MHSKNLTLLTDLYELTMMQGYYDKQDNPTVIFDVFYRSNPFSSGYAIAAGLEQVIEYVKNLNFSYDDVDYLRSLHIFSEDFLQYLSGYHFTGSIYAIPEGSLIFPKEPILKVVAPIMEAQLVETAILNILNHQCLIATKSSRIVYAAGDTGVMEFGLRRAQGPDTAFKAYADLYPEGCTLLVDTYDTLKSGVPNAIRVFQEMKDAGISPRKLGIRLDSGDLAYLSKKARKMLDEAGFEEATICASNDLDEYLIHDLKMQGAAIDSWGVGTNLITSKDCPSFGGVYKLAAIQNKNGEFEPKIKLSENTEKITNPGNKTVYRIYEKETGKMKADYICFVDEEINPEEDLLLFDPSETWKKTKMKAGTYTVREMMQPIFINGECVYTSPSVKEIATYCRQEKDTLWDESKRLFNPHQMYIDLSPRLYEVKKQLLDRMSADD